MKTIQQYTRDELAETLDNLFSEPEYADLVAAARESVNRWIGRGDHVAVYENHDFGSLWAGEKRLVSFGSPTAQLEVETVEELPSRLPDIGGAIGWRYLLIGVYTGDETL